MDHEVGHGDLNHGDAATDQALVVFAQPSVSAQTGEGAFDDPAFGQPKLSFILPVNPCEAREGREWCSERERAEPRSPYPQDVQVVGGRCG